MKRSAIIYILLFTIVLGLCACSKQNAELEGYTFGNVGKQVGADGSGYKKAVGELYEVTGATHSIAFSVAGSTMQMKTVHVWDTADGGKVACDSSGNYVYTTKDVTYDALAITLRGYVADK